MICECGHHMGAHRPFCRDCEFNTAGCRDFRFSIDNTMEALTPPADALRGHVTILPFSPSSSIGRAYFELLAEDRRYIDVELRYPSKRGVIRGDDQ